MKFLSGWHTFTAPSWPAPTAARSPVSAPRAPAAQRPPTGLRSRWTRRTSGRTNTRSAPRSLRSPQIPRPTTQSAHSYC
jgi:hypothetical protein